MCLGIPAKILSIDGLTAKASVGGAIVNASLHLVDDAVGWRLYPDSYRICPAKD